VKIARTNPAYCDSSITIRTSDNKTRATDKKLNSTSCWFIDEMAKHIFSISGLERWKLHYSGWKPWDSSKENSVRLYPTSCSCAQSCSLLFLWRLHWKVFNNRGGYVIRNGSIFNMFSKKIWTLQSFSRFISSISEQFCSAPSVKDFVVDCHWLSSANKFVFKKVRSLSVFKGKRLGWADTLGMQMGNILF